MPFLCGFGASLFMAWLVGLDPWCSIIVPFPPADPLHCFTANAISPLLHSLTSSGHGFSRTASRFAPNQKSQRAAHTESCAHTHVHTHTRTHTHTLTQKHKHTHTHALLHSVLRSLTHTCTPSAPQPAWDMIFLAFQLFHAIMNGLNFVFSISGIVIVCPPPSASSCLALLHTRHTHTHTLVCLHTHTQ